MIKRLLLPFALTLCAAGISVQPRLQAQPTRAELLQNIQDVESLDPEFEKFLPRWRVQEADLKLKLSRLFSLQGNAVTASDTFIVTATFPRSGQQELLVIRAAGTPDAQVSGTDKLKLWLGQALYTQILNRNYAHTVIEPEVPLTTQGPERVPSVLDPTMATQFIAVSAFRQAVQLGSTGARLEHVIGEDEIGYHFWSGGQARVFVKYPIIQLQDPQLRASGVPDILTIQLGAAYRLKFGTPDDEILGGFIPSRKLNGALGAKSYTRVEYRLPDLSDIGFSLNAEVPFEKIDTLTAERAGIVTVREVVPRRGLNTDTVHYNAYFLRTIAQGTVFWENWLNNYEHFFRLSLGVSYQEFARMRDLGGDSTLEARLQPAGLVHPTEVQDWIFARVDYLNQSGFPFGLSAQLANQNLLVSGFIPVLPNWLFLEAKYSTPILRSEAQPWENETFFMISPIIRFKLDR